ncbi:MAG: hypothetical protein VB041_01745, partial [Candidatus Limiplasma sp.]|nr:hypothetical protein [Candidatus Limiplasma sp.]
SWRKAGRCANTSKRFPTKTEPTYPLRRNGETQRQALFSGLRFERIEPNMQFTARQKELARWALRVGQSEADFARDNAMPIGNAKWLFELASADLRREERNHIAKVKRELENMQLRMPRAPGREDCRVHCAGYTRLPETV